MNLQLVKMEPQYRSLAEDMIREWKTSGEAIVPWAIDRADIRDFSAYMDSLEQTGTADGLVPESTFFCLDTDRNLMVGAINIRHYLNDNLLKHGGHIGDGVRPSERQKGIATRMIALGLEECKKLPKRQYRLCQKHYKQRRNPGKRNKTGRWRRDTEILDRSLIPSKSKSPGRALNATPGLHPIPSSVQIRRQIPWFLYWNDFPRRPPESAPLPLHRAWLRRQRIKNREGMPPADQPEGA